MMLLSWLKSLVLCLVSYSYGCKIWNQKCKYKSFVFIFIKAADPATVPPPIEEPEKIPENTLEPAQEVPEKKIEEAGPQDLAPAEAISSVPGEPVNSVPGETINSVPGEEKSKIEDQPQGQTKEIP